MDGQYTEGVEHAWMHIPAADWLTERPRAPPSSRDPGDLLRVVLIVMIVGVRPDRRGSCCAGYKSKRRLTTGRGVPPSRSNAESA